MVITECILCGTFADGCENDAIKYSFYISEKQEREMRISYIRFFILFILNLPISGISESITIDKIADVLIYTGAGAWDEGVLAFEKFLDFKGLTWYECDDTYIEDNDLIGKFDVIHFPGGNSVFCSCSKPGLSSSI